MTTEFIRPDGRKVDEMRNLEVEVGVLDRADGSAKAILGNNMAIASVFGPREMHPKHSSKPDRASVRINYRMATFSVKDYKKPFPSRREKEISKVLSEAFDSIVLTKMFPRSVVDVHVQIFQSDGGTRTAAAIAISAALADAGIPIRDLTGGIASGLYENMVCLDLNGLEDNVGSGDMPILYSPNIDEISLFQLDGLFTFEQFKKAYTYSIDAIKSVVETIQNALKQKYIRIRDELALEEEEDDESEVEYSSIDEDDEADEDADTEFTSPESTATETSAAIDLAGESSEVQSSEIADSTESPAVTETSAEVSVPVTSPEKEAEDVSTSPPVVDTASAVKDTDSTTSRESEATSDLDLTGSNSSDSPKSMTELISEKTGEDHLSIDEESDEGLAPPFDRSGLKPMGGIIQKLATDEIPDEEDENSDENLKNLYKRIKNEDDVSSNDILRDIEYSEYNDENMEVDDDTSDFEEEN